MRTVLEAMQSVDQWHLWRLEEGRKIPYQIDGVRKAKSNDDSTWASYDEALIALHNLGDSYELAFTLGERGLFTGIDFDDAYDKEGRPQDWAVEIFETIKDRCYAERSPSGTGFKAVILGQKPDGSRCSTNKGSGKQAIEIYDHNRFWAFTGETIVDCVDSVGSFLHVNDKVVKVAGLGKPEPKPMLPLEDIPVRHPVTTSNRGSRFSASETAEYRAKKYLDQVDRSTNARNNTIFSASGNIRAIDGLSDDAAWRLIMGLNSELTKGPLDDEELRKVFWSSGRNGTARDNKGANREFVAEAQIDPKALATMEVLFDADSIRDVPERSETLYSASDDCNQLPTELMRDGGFIEGFVDWVDSHQRYGQPELAFAAALHVVSVALSRKWADDSVYRTTPNMYSMVLSPSGSGKDLPRKMVRDFFTAMEHDVSGPSVIDSGAGLAASMADKPNMSMLLDECGDLFSNLASDRCPAHFKKVGVVLKTVYSSADAKGVQLRALANNDAGQNNAIDYPHLNIMATATENQVLSSVSDNQIEDGLMGRFTLFFGTNDPKKKRAKASGVPAGLARWFAKWTEKASNDALTVDFQIANESAELKVMARSDEAADRLDDHYDAISDRQIAKQRNGASLPEQTIWARASEKAAKLALLFAASRGSEVIELCDADRAIAVNNFLTRRIVKVYENRTRTEYQKLRSDVLNTITTNFTTAAQVFRLNSQIMPQMRNQIITDLIDSQEIHEVHKGSKTYYVRGKSPE